MNPADNIEAIDLGELAGGIEPGKLEFVPKTTLDELLPKDRVHRKNATSHRQKFDFSKSDMVAEHLGGLPEDGATWHIITAANYRPMDLVCAAINMVGTTCHSLHLTTLAMSMQNVRGIEALQKLGKLGTCTVLVSNFFRSMEPDTFTQCMQAMQAINVKAMCAQAHAKVQLLDFGHTHLVIEGSANLRSCNAVEQITITRDKGLLEFYRRHFETIIQTPGQ